MTPEELDRLVTVAWFRERQLKVQSEAEAHALHEKYRTALIELGRKEAVRLAYQNGGEAWGTMVLEELEQQGRLPTEISRTIAASFFDRAAFYNTGRTITTGNKSRNHHPAKRAIWALKPEVMKEIEEDMAKSKKKTNETTPPATNRDWHKKAMSVFMEQVAAGESLTGFTFDEIRAHMGLTGPDIEGYYDAVAAVQDLRDEGFLAHKFTHPSLKEDFFVGSPADVPNIQRRENENKIRQLVFFVSPAAMSISDEEMEGFIESASLPISKLEGKTTVFTRESMGEWLETLGELIDLHAPTDYVSTSAKMIAAFMPEK